MIPHHWTPEQVQRLLDSLAEQEKGEARTASLVMWRTGLRVGEAVALEWRDIDLAGGTLLVRQAKTGGGRTVPLHGDLVQLFGNWPARHGPRDRVLGLSRRTVLRHIRDGIEAAGLDEESPGTGLQKAGAHSLRHSAARHWLMTAGVPLNVVSQWLAVKGGEKVGQRGKRAFVQVHRLLEHFSHEEVHHAVQNALRLGTISLDAMKTHAAVSPNRQASSTRPGTASLFTRVNVKTVCVMGYMSLLSERAPFHISTWGRTSRITVRVLLVRIGIHLGVERRCKPSETGVQTRSYW